MQTNANNTKTKNEGFTMESNREGKHRKFNFDFLQKLGKVLMTVIAVMPAAGTDNSLGKLYSHADASFL